jgi:hypothetical protein
MAGLINDSGYGNITRDARKEMGDRGSKSDSVCKRATSRRFFSVYGRCKVYSSRREIRFLRESKIILIKKVNIEYRGVHLN